MREILVLYYSVGGSVRELAELVVQGIERVPGASARVRTIPGIAVSENSRNSESLAAKLSP